MIVNEYSLGFELLVAQKKQFEDVSLSSWKLWWAFFTFFFCTFYRPTDKQFIMKIRKWIDKESNQLQPCLTLEIIFLFRNHIIKRSYSNQYQGELAKTEMHTDQDMKVLFKDLVCEIYWDLPAEYVRTNKPNTGITCH